jgi:hypothetical protein
MAGSRMPNALQIGTTAFASLAAGVMLYVVGTLQVQEIQVVNTPVVISGTGTTSTQVTMLERDITSFATGTGGAANYDVFTFSNPRSFTGQIMQFCIDVKTASTSNVGTHDCGVVNDVGTGTATNLFSKEALSRGVHCADVTDATEVLLGPTERIKCGTVTSTGAGISMKGITLLRQAEL